MALTFFTYNKTLSSAGTQYSQQLPKDTRRWSMQCRTGYDVLFAFETGKVAGADGASASVAPYLTMKANGNYGDEVPRGEKVDQQTVFLASAQAGVVVEISGWADQ